MSAYVLVLVEHFKTCIILNLVVLPHSFTIMYLHLYVIISVTLDSHFTCMLFD